MFESKRTQKEVDDLESWAAEGQADGSHYPGQSYEDGIRDTLDWLAGRSENGPHHDE